MPTNWANQVALVTGGTRGVGQATVKHLATHGVAVAFLASPDAGWITAEVLTVDEGRTDYIGHG